ncbi:MAG: signal recognition particle protein, partial [Pseudomonadota bacterium]
GTFDLDDMASQLKQLQKIGGMEGLMTMLPGVSKIRSQLKMAGMDEKILKRQKAILSSMTPRERTQPKIIHASRKRRIAQGSGTSVQDINKLMKQFTMMSKMMKKAGKMDEKSLMRSFSSKMGNRFLPPMG